MAFVSPKGSVLGISFLLPLSAFAESGGELENVLVTGTYWPTTLSDLTSTVSVLDTEFLQATNKRTVADALQTIPGLLIENQGGAGGVTAVSIRGGEANFTLVMVDGVRLNDPTNSRGGGFNFAKLDISNIDRIEVVRGPQSALYGSDALAGVINIITRGPTTDNRQQLTTEIGEEGYRNYYADATGSTGDWGYALQLSRRESGEAVEGSQRDNDALNFALDWAPQAAHELKLYIRYLDGKRSSYPEQSGGPDFAVLSALDKGTYTDQMVGVNWGWQILPNWRSELRISHFDHDEEYSSPGIYPLLAVPPQENNTDFTRNQLLWINSFSLNEDYRIDFGADYLEESGDSRGSLDFGFMTLPTDFSQDRITRGLYVGAHARPLPKLLVQGSVRRDDPEGFEAKTTFNLGLKYGLTEQIIFKSNWGEAFKLPSFFALGHALVGNSGLTPETGKSWDIGLQWLPSDVLNIETHYFSNKYSDLIDFDSESFTNVNRNNVRTSGAELQVAWSPEKSIQLLAQASYTDIDIKNSSTPLNGRPRWKAGATALWQINSRWHAAIDYQRIGEQNAASRHTGDSVTEVIDGYEELGLNIAWQPVNAITVEVAVDNLLDEQYYNSVGFPGARRIGRISFSLSH